MNDVTEVEPIIVIGKRPKKDTSLNFEHQEEVDPADGSGTGSSPGDGGGSSPGMTDEEIAAENKRQERCAAQEFKNRLQSIGSRNSKESFSFILNRGEETLITPPATANGPRINQNDINPILSRYGINMSWVVGFAHNHPRSEYCPGPGVSQTSAQQDLNAYPSDNDWSAADTFVSHGADPNAFTLYIVGCDNILREFAYADRAHYKAQIQKANPSRPAAVQSDC